MYSLGIDVGTSGIRAVVMDTNHCILAQAQCTLPASQAFYSPSNSTKQHIIGYSQQPADWWNTLEKVLFLLAETLLKESDISFACITHLAIDGTSGTVLLCDESGQPVSEALMYNDQRAVFQAEQIQTVAPEDTAASGATSGLAKILWLYQHTHNENIHYALNQSDWLSGKLMGMFGFSDHNNALKMGYDAQTYSWPNWLKALLNDFKFPASLLPQVISPGQIMGQISPNMASHFGFKDNLNICAGTTDSTAAIIASGAQEVGDAVTSLGSTMVMKIVSQHAIFNKQSGIYSQPYGDLWLVGGASNSGGEVLKKFYSQSELIELTELLAHKVKQANFSLLDLNYYPLSTPGERFPINDPQHAPVLSPVPDNKIDFFQALLEGMADIESLAYQKLVDLGAPYPKHVTSMGGGAFNQAWRYIREQKLGVPVKMADQEQAASGSAILAQTSWS